MSTRSVDSSILAINNRSPRQASTGDRGLSLSYHVESERNSRFANDMMSQTMHTAQSPRDFAPQPISSQTKREGSMGAIDAKLAARKWLVQARRARLMRAASHERNNTSGREFRVESLAEQASERTSLMKAANDPLVASGASGSGTIFEDEYLPYEAPTTAEALKIIILGKPISVFLALMPLAWWASTHQWSPTWIFWLNFFVMVPLAAILGDFTEELALHTNETIGGLVNATFGNAVEVVVAIQALLANEIRVVQASMIGSIFSNLLLVLGCCFFFGGLRYTEQSFNSTVATANMALLALSSIAFVLPTPFAQYYKVDDESVLTISRAAAIFLMLMYIQLLVFQLKTHAHVFEEEGEGSEHTKEVSHDDGEANGATPAAAESGAVPDEDDEAASISLNVAMLGLLISTLLVTFFSEFLVDSIDGYCDQSGVSRTFVGLIILPIVGNAVEHITAISVAMKDKMDLAMGVAVGSCTQISLFVVPLTVLVGWMVDRPMNLNFPHFEIILYILSVFTVSVCLATPRSNWLEGSLLITTYCMIAVGFWFEKVITLAPESTDGTGEL